MTREDVAEKVANNVMLQAVARVGMAIVTLIGIPIGAWYFNSTASAISTVQDTANRLAERVSVVETNQRNSADRGTEIRAALAKQQDQLTAILQQVAALNATLASEPRR